VPVGAIRAFDMVADNPGDWAFHCHKTHHAMNAMGHDVRNFIGVQKRDLARQVRKLAPDYMPMGCDGMAPMGAVEMPMPDTTLPMMTGCGQSGPMERGGMSGLMKTRGGLAASNYRARGDYRRPPVRVASEVESSSALSPRRSSPAAQPNA